MFLITRPPEKEIRKFLESQNNQPFSYTEIGETRTATATEGYAIDNNRARLGTGRTTFDKAVEAVKNWKMFDIPWFDIYFDNPSLEVGKTVALLIRHFGFWSLNAARIVYILQESDEEIERFGFAYGTLAEHGERGEERFSVEYLKADESVWYDLYAFSKPNHLLSKLGYPVSRYLQKQFATESKAAMQKEIGN